MFTHTVLDYTHRAPQPHPQRARDPGRVIPKSATLFGQNPWTAVFVFGLVGIQLAVAYFASQTRVDLGRCWRRTRFGAFVNHGAVRAEPRVARTT